MPIRVAFCTRRGSTPGQQDSILVGTQVHQADDFISEPVAHDTEALLSIADGLAVSPRSGHVSRALLELLLNVMADRPDWLRDSLLSNRHLREAHARLCVRAERAPRLRGGASTFVAAHVRGDHVAIVNCGDSRAYLR